MKANRLLPLFIAVWFVSGLQAREGLIIHERFTTRGTAQTVGPQDSTRTTYLTSEALRQESSGGTELIVRFETGIIISVDHRRRLITRTTASEMNELLAQARENLPEEARKNIEKIRRTFGIREVDPQLTEQGEGEPVAGYPTRKYLVSMPPMQFEILSTPELEVPDSFYDALKMNAARSPFMRMDKIYDVFKKLPGMIMRSAFRIQSGPVDTRSTTEVFKIEQGDIPESRFDVPEDYRTVPFKP